MRPRTHLLIASLAGVALYPRAPLRAGLVAAAGVLVDLDHAWLYVWRSGDWRPWGMLRYFRYRNTPPGPGDHRPRYGPLRSTLHNPVWLAPLLLLARRMPLVRPLVWGYALHLLCDGLGLPPAMLAERRARGLCARCRCPGDLHVVPVRRGAAVAGWQVLCRSCARQLQGWWDAMTIPAVVGCER